MPNVPYPYEVNWQMVTENSSLTPICSLSKCSLSPSLTVVRFDRFSGCLGIVNQGLQSPKIFRYIKSKRKCQS